MPNLGTRSTISARHLPSAHHAKPEPLPMSFLNMAM
jgi:hypothetical protein